MENLAKAEKSLEQAQGTLSSIQQRHNSALAEFEDLTSLRTSMQIG